MTKKKPTKKKAKRKPKVLCGLMPLKIRPGTTIKFPSCLDVEKPDDEIEYPFRHPSHDPDEDDRR